ncbi:MAG: SRPBCC domain-containing protein [Thermosynechococcaceae cyanobacterium MS004]|nr:SRPBCC domain-containing protein [Thermosynechococcaceae cyanobacterium MS004]
MKSFTTSTIINASPETIWKILVDAQNWPKWNPTVSKVEGNVALGEKITVYAKVNPNRAFTLTVSKYMQNEQMVWTGGLPLGLFKGERKYTLSQASAGGVAFTMQEVFSGLLSPLIADSIPDLKPSFDEFAAALKECAER